MISVRSTISTPIILSVPQNYSCTVYQLSSNRLDCNLRILVDQRGRLAAVCGGGRLRFRRLAWRDCALASPNHSVPGACRTAGPWPPCSSFSCGRHRTWVQHSKVWLLIWTDAYSFWDVILFDWREYFNHCPVGIYTVILLVTWCV